MFLLGFKTMESLFYFHERFYVLLLVSRPMTSQKIIKIGCSCTWIWSYSRLSNFSVYISCVFQEGYMTVLVESPINETTQVLFWLIMLSWLNCFQLLLHVCYCMFCDSVRVLMRAMEVAETSTFNYVLIVFNCLSIYVCSHVIYAWLVVSQT